MIDMLDVPLCSFLFKRMLRKTPTLDDIEELDRSTATRFGGC